MAQGYDILVTGGGRQSNHVRLTVAAANRLGLANRVVLTSGEPGVPDGNVVLDHLLGADIVWAGERDHDGTSSPSARRAQPSPQRAGRRTA